MPLTFRYEIEPESAGTKDLPYAPDFQDGRTNRGFVDLRGRPDEARLIPEAASSPALQDLLASLATPGVPFLSIGCDTGCSAPTEKVPFFVAGGYLEIAFADLANPKGDRAHAHLAQQLANTLRRKSGDRLWSLNTTLSAVGTAQLGGAEQIWSLVLRFDALGDTAEATRASLELLLGSIGGFLMGSEL